MTFPNLDPADESPGVEVNLNAEPKAELAVNASMLARQTDLAREAETEVAALKATLARVEEAEKKMREWHGRWFPLTGPKTPLDCADLLAAAVFRYGQPFESDGRGGAPTIDQKGKLHGVEADDGK